MPSLLQFNTEPKMPAQVSGAYADVTMLNRVFNDTSPSNATYMNQVAAADSSGALPFALRYGAGYTNLDEAQLSALLLGNIGLQPNAGLQTALKDYLVSVGKANVGIVALQLGQILSGLESATGDQALYGAAAARWNREVAKSHYKSSIPSNTVPSSPEPSFPVTIGVTLSLADGEDVLPGTGHGDLFLADRPGQLGSTDVIGGGGRGRTGDVLKAALAAGAMVAPVLRDIDKVFIAATGGAEFYAGRSTGIFQLWREAAAGSLAFDGVNLATTVGIKDSLAGGALSVGFAEVGGAFDSANILLADATGADEVIVTGVEYLYVTSEAGTVASTTVNQANITADSAEEIVITGSQGLKTTVTGTHLATIDASGLAGSLELAFSTSGTGFVGFFGGRSGDQIRIDDASGARLVLVAGDGADTVTIGAYNAHIFTLGSGADTLHIGGLAGAAARDMDTSTSQALGWSAIWVTDFENGVDTLRLTAAGTTVKAALGEAQLASIAASASLLDAAALAATTAGAHKAVAFRYGADTYILVNDGAAALGANDSLVKLSGVTTLADASWTVA